MKFLKPVSAAHAKYLEKAVELSKLSTCRMRHGAIIRKSGRTISVGVNRLTNDPSMLDNETAKLHSSIHAEEVALRAARKTDLRGATIYIARINNHGQQMMSKPCPRCQNALTEAGIRKVYYTIDSSMDLEGEYQEPSKFAGHVAHGMKNNSYLGVNIDSAFLADEISLFEDLAGDKAKALKGSKALRDGIDSYHMTVFSPQETRELQRQERLPQSLKSNFTITGIGSTSNMVTIKGEERENTAYYLTVESKDIDDARAHYGFGKKDLHITLGFDHKDIHDQAKGESTIVLPM